MGHHHLTDILPSLMLKSMAMKDIAIYPERVLRKRAEEVKDIDFEIITLVQDMEDTMYAAPGVGLAAPQVSVPKRLILVDPTGHRDSGKLTVMINPEIIEMEGKETAGEMCLSVPELQVDVPRATRILVKGFDLNGKELRFEAEGFLARIFQHEIDHLNGITIAEYASSLKRSIYLKKRKKGKI